MSKQEITFSRAMNLFRSLEKQRQYSHELLHYKQFVRYIDRQQILMSSTRLFALQVFGLTLNTQTHVHTHFECFIYLMQIQGQLITIKVSF